ncbi:ABC transporter substrate-binding protein [Pseudomonas palmensis]|uniref:ABC transporter substrate-binding protein n=1 Tax=Pseudomonas palmensis TaxID=2815362 RepID=UPI0039ECE428
MLKHAVLPYLLGAGLLAGAPLAHAASNLVFCSEGSPAGFDPGQYTTSTDFDASAETVFNRLSQFERGGTAVIPGLATRWDISDDGLSYTFHLREGVQFHSTDYFKPSRPFNADDVLFTFNRMLDRNLPFRKAYPTEFPYFTDMGMDKNIVKLEKLDEHTVRFTLASVDAAFIQNMAMSFASIQSAEYAEQLLKQGKPADINQKPIGTGPFVFAKYQKDAQIRFKGNKAYWQPQDVKIDNPKALVHEAGVREGTEITLWAMPVQRPYNPNARLMAEMIQADWAKIGIKASIVSYEWGEYMKRAKAGENGAMLIGWSGDNGDPDNWLGTLYGCDAVNGNNFSKWCDPAYDALIKQAKATPDQARRTELYKQAQHIIKAQVPITPIAHSTVYQPMRKTVQDFKISPFGLNAFYGVSVSQ